MTPLTATRTVAKLADPAAVDALLAPLPLGNHSTSKFHTPLSLRPRLALTGGETEEGLAPRSTNMLDCTSFGDLSQIITANADTFATAFTSVGAVARIMRSLNLLRGPVAHCCAMSDGEAKRLGTAIDDLLRQIKSD